MRCFTFRLDVSSVLFLFSSLRSTFLFITKGYIVMQGGHSFVKVQGSKWPISFLGDITIVMSAYYRIPCHLPLRFDLYLHTASAWVVLRSTWELKWEVPRSYTEHYLVYWLTVYASPETSVVSKNAKMVLIYITYAHWEYTNDPPAIFSSAGTRWRS